MSSFLVVAYPEYGHVYPLLSLATALKQHGHRVAFYTGPAFAGAVAASGLTFCAPREWKAPSEDAAFPPELLAELATPGADQATLTSKLMCYQLLGSIAAMVRDIESYVRELNQPTVVHELLAPGAGLAAERLGLPWASVATHPLPVIDGYKVWMPADVWCWFDNARVLEELGLPARPGNLLGHTSLWLHLVPATPTFVGASKQLPTQVRLIGPLTWSPRESQVPAWIQGLANCPTPVLVGMSTIRPIAFQRTALDVDRYVRSCIEGLANEALTVIITLVEGQEPNVFKPLPANVRLERFVPHGALMPALKAVITHGGWGLVGRTLSHGLPMVLVPFGADQSVNAARCAELELGIKITLEELTPERVRTALHRVLDNPTYRANAQTEAQVIRQVNQSEIAVQALETLAG